MLFFSITFLSISHHLLILIPSLVRSKKWVTQLLIHGWMIRELHSHRKVTEMGSATNSNPNPNPYPWTPKDCSEGICSIYCPQWCYIVYSPPPPSLFLGGDDADDDPSGFEFSPLIVAVIGILASTFILVTYYTIISRFCRRTTMQSNEVLITLFFIIHSCSIYLTLVLPKLFETTFNPKSR